MVPVSDTRENRPPGMSETSRGTRDKGAWLWAKTARYNWNNERESSPCAPRPRMRSSRGFQL